MRTISENSFTNDGRYLSVEGYIIGSVILLSPIGDMVTDLPDPADITGRLLEVLTAWETWFDDVVTTRGLTKYYLYFTANFARNIDYLVLVKWFDESRNPTFSAVNHEEFKSIERVLFSQLHGCRLFVTDDGDVGIVADKCNVLVGDQFCYIPGVTSPVVLRCVPNGHKLMGPCYSGKYPIFHGHRPWWLMKFKPEQITLV